MLKHFLTGEEFSVSELFDLLQLAHALKKDRNAFKDALKDMQLALLFEKPSLRTRFSFTVAMRELGGDVIESSAQTSKYETPEDTAKVLSNYCDAIMLRTHDDSNLHRMTSVSKIPVINGLSDNHHPCQILADLMTMQEHFGDLPGLKLCYIGDSNNILNSFLVLATKLGVNVHYACPQERKPSVQILDRCDPAKLAHYTSPELAVLNAHAVYTDVWTSMGFESKVDESLFAGYQVHEELFARARPNAIFMHCMPMVRGKELSETLAEHSRSVIFEQSENRLHLQKALLLTLLKGL